MRKSFLFFLFGLGLLYAGLQSSSGGRAAGGNDNSGSPLSSSTCSACHGAASSNTVVSVSLLDQSGNVVTEYIPGEHYSIFVNVNNPNYSQYGAQAVILDGANNQAGTLDSVITSNTQISTVNNRSYWEHQGRSSTGNFTAAWTAPAAGTGTVTVYAMGNAVDSSGSTSGDAPSSPISISFTEVVSSGLVSLPSEGLRVWPNPSPNGQYFFRQTTDAPLQSLRIFNSQGQLIREEQLQGFEGQISLENEAKGLYYLELQTEKGRWQKKLVR
ncbi:hypothetical protein SapgrDRAFT_1714 [Saprospira grandis DSM 2844]|uniref:Secretion system C-terminal sorting domain-containing protein n=1 Tax=Saprospira grandis DSM 2844 TaxID=694433 RepID=J1I4X7_9BACT|nr:choice-of-anchor V domain-containing protein [Saprospira grandis]EJF53418.1 hypothetical protein SapgrDRAFT_1714 [Saprospira grandis DSM 2844]